MFLVGSKCIILASRLLVLCHIGKSSHLEIIFYVYEANQRRQKNGGCITNCECVLSLDLNS